MKYAPDKVNTILSALVSLKGRVKAAQEAGLSYDTFCQWMKKPEFAEAVKRAEGEMAQKGKEMAVMSIFQAMPTQWTAAAWWLERKHPDEYANKAKLDIEFPQMKIDL